MAQSYRHQEIKVGDRFGRLEVSGETCVEIRGGQKRSYCPCVCVCGNHVKPAVYRLITGVTQSCGCLSRELSRSRKLSHGMSHTQLHNTWCAIKRRCYTPKDPSYADYGGRGIRVCSEWLGSFEVFRDWALANGYQDGLTIERENVNGDYEPSNCTWIPLARQALNRRTTRQITAFGETRPLAEWIRDPRCTNHPSTFYMRKRRGMSDQEALSLPDQRLRA